MTPSGARRNKRAKTETSFSTANRALSSRDFWKRVSRTHSLLWDCEQSPSRRQHQNRSQSRNWTSKVNGTLDFRLTSHREADRQQFHQEEVRRQQAHHQQVRHPDSHLP